MNDKLLYLKQNIFEAKEYTLFENRDIYSLKNELTKIAEKHFFTIETYRKNARKYLKYKNKIPFYFSPKLLLFSVKTKSDENYFINFFSIFKICYETKVVIIFENGNILKLDVSKKIILSELNKIKNILKYIENLL